MIIFFQKISITGAKLAKLAENAFGGLKAVERLIMHDNYIKHIPNIDPLKPTLKELQLQRNNISEIDENYFKGFEQLEDIFLEKICWHCCLICRGCVQHCIPSDSTTTKWYLFMVWF